MSNIKSNESPIQAIGQLKSEKEEEKEEDVEEFNYLKIRLDIIDTGVGIKKENLSKLFMDFSRLDEHSNIN